VKLDQESYPQSGHSARYEGFTMVMSIQYQNSWPWVGVSPNTVSYQYILSADTRDTYSSQMNVWDVYPTNRTTISKHGVYVDVIPSGTLAKFSFNNLLIQLTTSLTLLAISGTIVSALAKYVLRHRMYYRHAMYDKTPDFSDLSELDVKSWDELCQIARERGLPANKEEADDQRVVLMYNILKDGWLPDATRHSSGTSFMTSSGNKRAMLRMPLLSSSGTHRPDDGSYGSEESVNAKTEYFKKHGQYPW